MIDDFKGYKSWFDRKYSEKGPVRHLFFKLALGLLKDRGGSTIVETGCAKADDDWGSGMSTVLLGDFCKRYGKKLHSVDLSASHMDKCKQLTNEFSDFVSYNVGDSAEFLKSFDKDIDLLYLDSYDYPYGDLLDIYGGKKDINKAISILKDMDDDIIVSKHWDIIKGSQNHCLNEFLAAEDKLTSNSIVMLDDVLPGGGKGRLTRDYLLSRGWTLLLEGYQQVFVRGI